jgi:uncharacterized protein DUF2842
MSLSWRARRRWALVALLIGLPVYIALAVEVVSWFDRPPLLVELAVYVALGVAWALPLRVVFLSVGRPEPADERAPTRGSRRAE